jgi:hypothetical protein
MYLSTNNFSITDTFSMTDLLNLSNGLAQTNAMYLAVSVTIILATGAAFYFFNLKPLQEKISKQEEELEKEKNSNKEKLEKLTDALNKSLENVSSQTNSLKNELSKAIEEKIENADKRIAAIEDLAHKEIDDIKFHAKLEKLSNLWDKHYLWITGGLKVSLNALLLLIIFLEESIKNNMLIPSPKSIFEEINTTLGNLKEEQSRSHEKKQNQEYFDRLITALNKLRDMGKLVGNEKEIEKVNNEAREVLIPNIEL